MTNDLWPNAAVKQDHYAKDWTRHPVYIMDHHKRHPLYDGNETQPHDHSHRTLPVHDRHGHCAPRDRKPLPHQGSGPSVLFRAIARQRGYPDYLGALPYDQRATPPSHRSGQRRPAPRAIGRCRVVYPEMPQAPAPPSDPGSAGGEARTLTHTQSPVPRQPAPGTKPRPTPAPHEPETVSLLNPTGRFAEKVAAVRRLREFDESVPHEHLPQRRLVRKKSRRFLPRITMLVRCKECEQPWPCHPLRANLHRTYGANITAKIKELSTKKNRAKAGRRSPTSVRHRGWTPRTWYGKPLND